MGWGRFLLLGNLGQQLDLTDQKREIEALRDELRKSRIDPGGSGDDIAGLQAEIDELRLYLAAIVRLLISKGVIDREEMRRVVDSLDAEDGARDGKYTGRIK